MQHELSDELETHRHECEARYVLNLPDRKARNEYLQGVEKQRGRAAALKLKKGVEELWNERNKQKNQTLG